MPETDGISGRMIQDSSSMLIGEGYALQDYKDIPGFKQTTNFKPGYTKDEKKKKKNLISKVFSNLSRWGMDYDEDIVKNLRAIPADKNLLPKQTQLVNQDLFTQLSSSWKVKSNADKNFFEKDFPVKREALRNLAVQPELEDILDTMANECIVYDPNYVYIAEPYIEQTDLDDFNKNIQKKITDSMSKSYKKLYRMLKWRTNAWDDFKRFLVEGILAWEIVYDSLEKPTKIIGMVPLDAATLTKKYENGKWYWIQYKGMQGKERKLLDSQVVYIAFQETNCVNRLSYLERLIRPFNIYRIIEQAQIVWTVTNAQYKMKFTIPTKNMNRVLAQQTLMSAMNRYKEDIKFISDTGELTINGQVNMPFNKEYWMPDNENGTPEIETVSGDGPELNDNDQLKYFKNILYKISKIPLSRFDQESGETWFGADASSTARTEIDFARYVHRLRNPFSQIILKPLQIQMVLDIPELIDNKEFLECVQLHYKSYNLFEELMEIDLMEKRVDFIKNMKDGMVDMDKEGNEIKFWSSEFLVQKYLHMSDADLKLNNKMKQEEIESLNLAGGETEDEEEEEDMFGGSNEGKKEEPDDGSEDTVEEPGSEYDPISDLESLSSKDKKLILEMIAFAKKRSASRKKKPVKYSEKEENPNEEE